MSNPADDDIWAGVRQDTAENASKMMAATNSLAQRLESGLGLTPSSHSLGALEKRETATDAFVPEVNATRLDWDKTGEETDGPILGRGRRRAKSKPAPTLLIGATAVALMWLTGSSLFVMQNLGANGADGPSLLFSMLVIVLGTSFALLAGFMGESVAKSNREARMLMNAARKMLDPNRAGESGLDGARAAEPNGLGAIQDILTDVAARLKAMEARVGAGSAAPYTALLSGESSANVLTTLEGERARLDTLLASLSDLASRAEASTQSVGQNLETRAASLAASADSLAAKSTTASDLANAAAQRLEVAASRAVTAIEQLDQAAGRGEAALARAHDLMVLARVRADEAIGSVSNAVASLHDAATTATETASLVSETIFNETEATRLNGLTTLDEVRHAALSNAQLISDSLRQEAEAAREAGAETLAALQASADAVRFAAEEARQLAQQQVIDTQRQVDLVRQTASEAAQDADVFMTNRVNEAREMIERSAGLLDETGTRIQERFGRLAAACADQARAVEDLLDGLDRRLGNLPMEAEARAKAIEEALSDTLERLTQAGRQAANETAALDIAFQDRLRESYAALGEVVTRLGGLSGVLPMPETKPIAAKPEIAPIVTPVVAPVVAPVADVAPQTAAPEPVKAPAPEPRPQPAMARKVPPEPKPLPPLPKRTSLSGLQASVPAAPAPTPASDAAAPSGFATQMSYHPQSTTSAAPASAHTDAQVPPPAPQPDVALPIEGNTRLRISSPIPVEDDPFAELQLERTRPDVTAAEPVAETNWSWKQLLSSMDDKGAKSSANQISNLVGELDLETALPSTALDKIRVLAMKSRDQSRRGTREYARAEVRAMRQKLTSDPALRAIVVRFVETRKEAATKGRLSGNPARVYFVADAALEA